MPTFQLFRAQAHVFTTKAPQLPFEEQQQSVTPREALTSAISEAPSAALRRGHAWHLGNVTRLDDSAWYLAIGRTSRSTIQVFDEESKVFADGEFDNAPYTHVIIDTRLGLCAIAPKPRLARDAVTIGRQLQRLLNRTQVAATDLVEFEIAPVSDPGEFVRRLRAAFAIRKVTFTFGLPNAWDLDRQIIQPAQRAAMALRAKKGSASFAGDSLDKEGVEELVRSSASTGQDVSASVQDQVESKSVTIRLSKDAVLFRTTEEAPGTVPTETLDALRSRYREIRATSPGEEKR